MLSLLFFFLFFVAVVVTLLFFVIAANSLKSPFAASFIWFRFVQFCSHHLMGKRCGRCRRYQCKEAPRCCSMHTGHMWCKIWLRRERQSKYFMSHITMHHKKSSCWHREKCAQEWGKQRLGRLQRSVKVIGPCIHSFILLTLLPSSAVRKSATILFSTQNSYKFLWDFEWSTCSNGKHQHSHRYLYTRSHSVQLYERIVWSRYKFVVRRNQVI